MGGPKGHGHVLVVLRALVLVAHQHGYRCAQGEPIEQAAEDFHPILFLARGGDSALPRPSSIELGLDPSDVDR
jgi:hypothetical protein